MKKIVFCLLIFITISFGCKKSKINDYSENVEFIESCVIPDLEEENIKSEETPKIDHQELIGVDLNLPSGILWASVNLGANEPWENGNYYNLGIIYPGCLRAKDYDVQVKDIEYNAVLSGDPRHDAATATAGLNWRTPSYDDFKELKENCKWVWTILNGHEGYWVIGKNGNSIFLPAAGTDSYHLGSYGNERGIVDVNTFGNYMWYSTEPTKWLAGKFMFKKDQRDNREYLKESWDSKANSIRAVTNNYNVTKYEDTDSAKYKPLYNFVYSKPTGMAEGHGYVDLGLPSGTKWAASNIGAISPLDIGSNFTWGSIKAGERFTKDNYPEPPSFFGGDSKYDAATALWGESWRIPSWKNMNELLENCKWIYMSKETTGDKNSYVVLIGPNSNSIILPAGINGDFYWSTSISDYNDDTISTIVIDPHNNDFRRSRLNKYYNSLIRPVLKKE